ncbi:(3R)-3-hydroxyacyl-CoA dehydrogenase-like [Homalodisca vitripennis]|uniref:(3R)-3-hydroxyacyl-CoA dehydrogenase-like n=1 Tax=Homalodisca vitripennis TaxID=197043 RepID=UPI001EEC51E9|nr:(3R)-3-hydroxyacyl-CoA dehydrogenase-like [Homalodisca vitripennis]XP_046685289.1 (3R)-3-hydroxyacyl-CoA dehydrogenase-like [Homalodisca vitripennis]
MGTRLVEGRLALVTGASSGIGRETCKVLAREGATVVVTCVDEAGAQETVTQLEGTDHIALWYDVTKFDSAAELVKTIKETFGRPPDILVNCAGIGGREYLFDLTPESFQRDLDVNLKGTFFTSQAVCRELVTANMAGSVVNISSLSVHYGSVGLSAYISSKGGVDAITKCINRELGHRNIRVNSVQPGVVDTAMPPEAFRATFAKLSPMKRIGQPQEIAEVIVFLASERASYISGADYSISGGVL